MEKTIIYKCYLDQFLKDFETYYSNLGNVSKEISYALFQNKNYTFEKATENTPNRDNLEEIVERVWRITQDEDTVIAVLQKLDCDVI